MKKLLIILTIFFSTFLIAIDKPKAFVSEDGTNYVKFQYDYDKVKEITSHENFQNAIDYIMNDFNNSDYDVYVIYFAENYLRATFGYDGFRLNATKSLSSTTNDYYLGLNFETNSRYKNISYNLDENNGRTTYESLMQKDVARYSVITTFSYDINELNINDSYPYFAIYDSNTEIYTFSWNENFYLFYDLNNNELISHGGTMPLAKDMNYSKKMDIDVTNIASIKINFDTKNTTYDDYHFTVLSGINQRLKEAYYEKSYVWGLCLDENTCYDDYIFRENLYINEFANLYAYSSPFKYEDLEHGFVDETQELNYFYLYYDVSDISGIVNLSVQSTAPFEIEYTYLEDYTDTYVTLNLNGYSGLLLYPIVNNYNGDYPFKLNNANINIYQYYDGSLVGYYKNITSTNYSIGAIENYDRNRYFLIENNKKNEDSYISFSTKYFYYQLVENTNESIEITNPNTKEDEIINSIDISQNMTYFMNDVSNVNGMLDFIKNNNNLDTIFSKFTDVWNSFKSDGKIYIYLMLVITTSIIILIIKSMGK